MQNRTSLLVILSFVLMAVVVETKGGTKYYISPSGNDENSGVEPEEAWMRRDQQLHVKYLQE